MPDIPSVSNVKSDETELNLGILSMGLYWKGLFRDAEIIAWGI
jgi:hypothetical protein